MPENFTLLQVTPTLDSGGVEQATLDMAGAVARLGRRSLVASYGGRLEPALIDRGGELIRLPVQARNPLSLVLNAARLAAIVRREKVSLIHVRSRSPAFSVLAASRMTAAPMVATYHGIYSARSGVKRWYNSIMTRGDLTVVNSEFTRQHVIAEHSVDPARIVLVHEGIDTRRFDAQEVSAARVAAVRASWGIPPVRDRPVILMAARAAGWKGHAIAVRAFSRLAGLNRAWLIVTGPEPGVPQAAPLAPVIPGLRLVDACDDMPAAFLAADLVVAPSTRAESFGRSVVEAGAMARPVLASSIGAHLETVVDGETGWLAPPGDVAAWTAALEAALATPAHIREAMGRAAAARVRRLYSLSTMYAETFAVYRRALEGRR